MKSLRYLVIVLFLLVSTLWGSYAQGGRDVLYQASIFNALIERVYETEISVKDLKQHGDFGIGTYNGLDGELIALDGDFYQIDMDGVAHRVDDSMKTPFAGMTFFKPDRTASLDRVDDFKQLKRELDRLLPTKNIFYAIKIEAAFKYIKARSVPKQKRPYPSLSEIFKVQAIFEFRDVRGTIVGFRYPSYVRGINRVGYHFHFISEDRKQGGHVMECSLEDALVGIDFIPRFYLALPEGGDFFKVELLQ